MPRKQSGGSPASTNVMNINTGYLKALSESPVGGQVSGIAGCQSGGSVASARVNDLLSQESCVGGGNIPMTPTISGDPANLPLYKTSGGGNMPMMTPSYAGKMPMEMSRSGKGYGGRGGGKKSKSKRVKSQKGAGSDFVNLLYARGPVNNPSMSPDQFKQFAGPYDQYLSSESLFNTGLHGAAPFPFPQKGGKSKRSSKSKRSNKLKKSKSKSKSKLSKSNRKSKSKSKSMSGGNRKIRNSIRHKLRRSLNRKRHRSQ